MNNINKSISAYEEAKNFIPGGVNSPVRSFNSVDGSPPFIEKADGGYIYDIDGNKYIDYVQSWGPMILGHNDADVKQAVLTAVEHSLSFGAPTVGESELAKEILEVYDCLDKIRLVSSGTEAVMSAIRLARGYTKKDNIIKFAGCYHGHSDSLLIQAGSGLTTFGSPSSPGVPADFAKHTMLATYNDIDSVKKCFEGGDIACVIIEPIAGNMGLIPSSLTFLKELRELCDANNSLLIFDEVMSGFRAALGGAYEIYGIKPDIVTLGKVIGGGMPIGAFGARKEIINELSPLGSIYQAGTLSGNPISVAAGLSTLRKLKKTHPYPSLEQKATILAQGMERIAKEHNIDITTTVRGSMFGFFFSKNAINNFDEALECDTKRFASFHKYMIDNGIYLACSAFESGFISAQTSEEMIQKTLDVFEGYCKQA